MSSREFTTLKGVRMRQGLVFSIIVMGMACASALAAGGTLPGSGTEASPYLIEDVNDFDTFANAAYAATYWAAGVHTKLTTDIDLSGRTYTTAVIAPDTGTPFSGYFDGNSHLIVNLRIEKSGHLNGLFGSMAGSNNNDILVQDLSLTDPNIIISFGGYTGALVGIMQSCKIDNCHTINGAINSTNDIDSTTIGGLVGYCINATLSNSTSSTEVVGSWKDIGGLVGGVDSGTLTDCSASGAVRGANYGVGGLIGTLGGSSSEVITCSATGDIQCNFYGGGLIGKIFDGQVQNSCAIGNVSGTSGLGGLVGSNIRGTIQNCFSLGNVTGDDKIGGLAGYNSGYDTSDNGGVIDMSYSAGRVVGNTNVGGFCGYQRGDGTEMVNSFWDMEASGVSTGYNLDPTYPGTITNVLGKTTAEMQTQSTFTVWDFDPDDGDPADWMMLRPGEDYPRLAWQETFMGDIAGLYGVDLVDFAYLAGYWGLGGCGSGTDCGRADIDGSGDVGLGDLVYVAQDWLK